MGVTREAARTLASGGERRRNFLAVVGQIFSAESTLEKSPCVHARRTVRLKKHQVASVLVVAGMEEVVEAGFEQIGRAGVAGDMATQFTIGLVGTRDHRQGIPAHERGQSFFNRQVAWEGGLTLDRNAVDIGCAQIRLPTHLPLPCQANQLVEHEAGAVGALRGQQGIKGFTPLLGFGRVCITRVFRSLQEGEGEGCVHRTQR